jgi:hypothetical protein
MNHLYGVNEYTYARYCTETDLFKKLPELDLDPDPDLVAKFPDPAIRIRLDPDLQHIYLPQSKAIQPRFSEGKLLVIFHWLYFGHV